MAKVGHEKIGELISEMAHYDPDNMEMAAKRLSELILAGEVSLEEDPKTAEAIRKAYMKQIDSENDTVQSEAIKYLANIVPKLPSSQIKTIFDDVLEHITNSSETEKKREHYGACVTTVIYQYPCEYDCEFDSLFKKSVDMLLSLRGESTKMEIIFMNIIIEFIKKWPVATTRLNYDRKGLVIYLLKNIQTKSKLEIIKKSETCLGKVVLVLDRSTISIVLSDDQWGLLRFIIKSHTKLTLDNLKNARNGLLCLVQILKTQNAELGSWAKEMSRMLLAVINQFKNEEDIDNIEVVCDVLDAALTGLAFLVKTFSEQLREELESKDVHPYSSFLKELIDFNVEGMMGYVGEEMEIE